MDRKIIIAIDGYSSCGKSTLAKELAQRLGYRYIDTGAMYRAVTWYFYDNNVDKDSTDAVNEGLKHITIDFEYDAVSGKQITILNGKSIEKEIRTPFVSERVSPVSTIKEVRRFLVNQQQKMGAKRGLVMDGRDIGTVVFPDAELKLFMTADENIRAERRFEELKAGGVKMSMHEVLDNLRQRDYIDTHREESPLTQAADAIVIDNSNLTRDEQLELAYGYAMEKMGALA